MFSMSKMNEYVTLSVRLYTKWLHLNANDIVSDLKLMMAEEISHLYSK